MTLASNQDWAKVEAVAAQHEIREQDHYLPVKPVPMPTQAQALAFATQRCAELQARLIRLQGKAIEAGMWLDAGERDRAKQAINAVILDL